MIPLYDVVNRLRVRLLYIDTLFNRYSIDDYFINLRKKMYEEIDKIPSEDIMQIDIVPVKPKLINIQPKPGLGKPVQEPELALSDYDEILNVIQSMAKVYEWSPSVFREMEEEHLRTIPLVGLNGLFKGNATGETFNGEDKNDILICVNDNNIFIAECLFWDGPALFKKKITEQLLQYSTWRDSKLAAIVFNRKKDFTMVVQKMREVTAGLDNLISEMPYTAPHSCRHRFYCADDPQKHYILTCMAFEVPS